MRILFTFVGGNGHFEPLIPIADAAREAGHTVVFTCRPSMARTVAAAGFDVLEEDTGREWQAERRPLLAVSTEREDQVLRDAFAGRMARERAASGVDLYAAWEPDLLVCEEMDFGSVVVAERLGLPYARVLVIAEGSFVRHHLIAEPLNELRAEHGLPADPGLEMLGRHLVLAPFPPGFRHPDFPLPPTGQALRPRGLDAVAEEAVPKWIGELDDAPTVYFTLGTVFNVESGDLFARVLKGLRDLPVNVVVTVGKDIDPAELGPQPGHVRIERFVPQAALLPHCDVVVSHGGSGSVIGALAYGLPSVLIPMGADQPQNAARCAALGVSRVLDAVSATPDHVREAVVEVLADASYRLAAEGLRDEIAALPGADRAVALLEDLVAEQGLPG
ncbi:glycosyltransferase family 1 protein [Streptomyces sp. So13.3]|uniref:glycosyltransferase n=1 Tax=Streptomyces TaxID=1883 RepID=UPI001105F235|nr:MULTISPECIES: glycosyltransferase [Streptomyces]MCZ4098798.1 glycosyltransferase [Streptomyces sp. H39-C1]QNA71481.1 glycosyltransferase family 1 protein [Streptomyces sp. So13.3]